MMVIYTAVMFLTLFLFALYHLILAARGVSISYWYLIMIRGQLMKNWGESTGNTGETLLIMDSS